MGDSEGSPFSVSMKGTGEREWMVKFINLTPHLVRVCAEDGKTVLAEIPPDGRVARVETLDVLHLEDSDTLGCPIWRQAAGGVTGLPEADGEALWVVSSMVRAAVPARMDVFSPGRLVRGQDGQPTGCVGLVANGRVAFAALGL